MSEQWKYKMLSYEVEPPAGVWEKIVSELKETNELLPLSQKIYDYEVAPPPIVWTTIATALESHGDEKKPVPVKRIGTRIFTIMAAAAFLGAIILGSFYIYNAETKKKQVPGSPINASNNKNSGPGSLPSNDEPLTAKKDEDKPQGPQIAAAITGVTPVRAKKNSRRGSSRIMHNAIVRNVLSLGSNLAVPIPARPIRDEEGDIIQNTYPINTAEDPYINITGPNGQQTRISSKFMNVLMYINGDSGIEEFEGFFDKSFIESLVWKTRFQEWRKKIIQTSFIPSSTNFLDILEFKDLITKENQ